MLKFKGTNIRYVNLHEYDENLVRVVLPFKDQRSADIVRNRLKDLSRETSVTIQPVFVSRKIKDLLKIREKKPSHC